MAGAALKHQEAMDIDHHCNPEEALDFLMENNLSCNLRVLGCQLGLKPSDLDTLLPPDQSHPYQYLLLKVLSKCSEKELLSWIKLASILRRPALKQYRIANKMCTTYGIMTGSSESDSIASLQSPGSGSLERSLTFMYSISDDNAGKLSKHTIPAQHQRTEKYFNNRCSYVHIIQHVRERKRERKRVKELIHFHNQYIEPEISEVVNEIADVKDWEQLAISLGLTVNDIDLIKQYDHREHHQRLAELWSDRAVDYSWGKLRRELDQFYPRRASDASVTSLSPEVENPQAGKEFMLYYA